jgi:hypothetical protein
MSAPQSSAIIGILWCHIILLLALGTSSAQPLSNLVFTVGTTIQDAGHQNWSYVVLGSPQFQLLGGKRFAVYGKTGLPADPGSFTLRGTIFPQTDTTAINSLLNKSVGLGEDLTSLGGALDVLLRNVPNISSQTLPQKVLTALQTAINDPSVAPSMLMLARMHPGFNLCSGQGFAEVITVTTTYEVREVDPGTGVANEVVGRVTIFPGAPVILPAPGVPFQVVTNAPSDHLRIRLRWGTPDALRRLSLLQFGFNVWRIPRAAAEAANFNVTPPDVATLHANPSFTRVNTMPVMATTDYAPLLGPGGPNDPSDRTTYFLGDSNGRSPGIAQFPPGQTPPGYLATPFNDGDQFYYFVTARDILGRDGLVSPGGLATACRRMPPSTPTNLTVFNTTQVLLSGGAKTNQERLLLRWAQNTNAADLVTGYWIYRWPNPAMALINDATPSNNVVGIVAQASGTNLGYYLDTSADAPLTPGPTNYWYTVRAVSQGSCDPLFSPNSAPASGVLRQRDAPPATTGELIGSCGSPVVVFQKFNFPSNPNGPDTNHWNCRVTVTRRDAGIAWVQFTVGNTNGFVTPQSFGPLYFAPDADTLSMDLSFVKTAYSPEFDVICTAGTYYGVVSQAAVCQTTTLPASDQITEAVFQTGELLFTALSSSDPLLQAVNAGVAACFPAEKPTRDPSGVVHMTFPNAAGNPLLIQFSTNGVWTDLGVATADTNRIYSIYLCPCIIAALPPLRGCLVNLPEGNCQQHVARASDSGPIAPIHIRFRLTRRTHEYRVYRSVDGGEPTMISQAAALFDPANPNNEWVVTDDAMPPGAARLCYFVQTLDENGNGSPLAFIDCRDNLPPKPPRPTLAEPAPIGDLSHPQVALNWFCPTAGVYRFEVRLHQDPPESGGSNPTNFLSRFLIPLPNVDPKIRFLGLRANRALFTAFEDWRLTPPVGPGYGPGPQFSLTADVVPNVTYHISVAAENGQGHWGDASTEWTFVWKPPPTNLTVPWPARPLSPVTSFDDQSAVPSPDPSDYSPRVTAVLMKYYDTQTQQLHVDSHYPVGIRFAELQNLASVFLNIGNTNFARYAFSAPSGAIPVDPNNYIFKRYSNSSDQNGQPLLPIVVYRQQVTNANYPRVSGNLTQVTPLLERIPWVAPSLRINIVTIADRLIAFSQETWNDRDYSFLYLRDQQPVILGASYHYYVVRLNDQREVSEVIDAGTVDIPATP